jgi:hypothetical protein
MDNKDYWEECISVSFEENEVAATTEQIKGVADDVRVAHENYGMAFYQPPYSDRIADIEREWKRRLEQSQAEFDAYRDKSKVAVREALNLRPDSNITIEEHGEVLLHDGGSRRVQ